MSNNLVKKHDYNKGGYHKDFKNDYDRSYLKQELEKELDQVSSDNLNEEEKEAM